jgi:hypothetical protein
MCILYDHHPFKATFQGGPYQNVRYIFWDPHLSKIWSLNVPQVSFLWGGSSKYLQNVSLHFQGPPQKHLEKCSVHFGYVPPLKGC